MDHRSVKTEIELRVTFDHEPGTMGRILKTLGCHGGSLKAHLAFRNPGHERMTGLFLCEEPTAAVLALREEGFDVTTETVVTVQTERRPRALNHLVHSLELEDVRVGYTYAASNSDELFVVLRTDDNPRAEDILRAYLELSNG
jgi:hypothetical protein